jgi:hypothetical protein
MGLAEELESEAYIALGDERSGKLGDLLRLAAERIRNDAHELDDTIATCDRLEAQLTEARRLLREQMEAHRDPESWDYNDCDNATGACRWCQDAAKIVGEG